MQRPLEGVRVLDLTRLLPGPFATLVLADMGASVDKIEDPHGGDYLRHMPPQLGDQNAAFLALNRGKRSMVLDLKRPEGRATLERLLPRYDVLVEQFRPGVLDRLGLSHARLRTEFPHLVVAAITGYGQTGPLAHRAGHDLNYLARSGVLGLTGPESGPPQPPGFQLADVAGGLWAVIGLLGALRAREATGQGAVVDIAMSEGTLPFAMAQLGAIAVNGTAVRGGEALTGGIAPYATYATKDGRWVSLGALEPKFWKSFCDGAGLDLDMTAMMPGAHQPALRARLTEVFATRTRDEWAAFGAERDCCLEPVLEPHELASDPHLVARGILHKQSTPWGESTQVRLPVAPPAEAPAPAMGEHTRTILGEGGFSAEEIDALVSGNVVR
ncbi:MAG: CoA transferase [Myxococcales bacterium]|nr:CoA transferase [Myxococcales bacterium]